MVMVLLLVGRGVQGKSVLLVLFPHLTQSLSPANNLQRTETGLLVAAAVTLHISRRFCFAFFKVKSVGGAKLCSTALCASQPNKAAFHCHRSGLKVPKQGERLCVVLFCDLLFAQ